MTSCEGCGTEDGKCRRSNPCPSCCYCGRVLVGDEDDDIACSTGLSSRNEFEDVTRVLENWFESMECTNVRHLLFSYRTKAGAHITVEFNRNPRPELLAEER